MGALTFASFILALLAHSSDAVVVSPCADPEFYTPTSPSSKYRVIIVGAGWAGGGAASEIQRFNNHQANDADKISFRVLEANSFIGGRGAGAHWIVGGINNPLGQLHKKYAPNGGSTVARQRWSDAVFYDINGKVFKNQAIFRMEEAWANAYDYLYNTAANLREDEPDVSFRDILDKSYTDDWPSDSAVEPTTGVLENILEWYDVDYEFTASLDKLGTLNYPLGAYEEYGYTEWYLKTGENSATILLGLLDDPSFVNDSGDSLLDIFDAGLTWSVTSIDYSSTSGVEVMTSNGSTSCTIYADKVISTLSVGKLYESLPDLFMPRGSNSDIKQKLLEKKKAMEDLFINPDTHRMGDYKEIRFQFPRDDMFWDPTQIIAVETDDRSLCNLWQNLDTGDFYLNSRTLICSLMSEGWKHLLGEGKEATQSHINSLFYETLGKVYGKDGNDYKCTFRESVGPSPQPWDPNVLPPSGECWYWFFQDNPFWGGSYSFYNVYPGTKGDALAAYDIYRENLDNKVYISGTATCANHQEYTHGGYMSGLATANAVINDMTGLPNPVATSDDCETSSGRGFRGLKKTQKNKQTQNMYNVDPKVFRF